MPATVVITPPAYDTEYKNVNDKRAIKEKSSLRILIISKVFLF